MMANILKITTILLVIALSPTFAKAENSGNIGVVIQNGQFVTREGIIPAGCFAQLITEMNGDNSVASIFIHPANLRGCMDANYPYPGGDENKVSYSIEKLIHPNLFGLRVCVAADGSMGGTCDNVLIDFNYRNYVTDNGIRAVLTVSKVGEWK